MPEQTQDTSVEGTGKLIAGLLETAEGGKDVPAPKPETPEPPETTKEEPQQGKTDDVSEPEEKEPEGKEATTQDESADKAEEEQEAEELRTWNDVAKRLGVEPEALNQIRIQAKVDGQDTEATLHDLVSSYQQQGYLSRKSQELSEAQRQAEAARAQYQQQVDERIQQLDDVMLGLNASLQMKSEQELAQLQQEDETAFLLEVTRQNQIKEKIQRAFNERDAWIQSKQAEAQQQREEFIAQQKELVTQIVPQWKDPVKATTERAQIRQYLQNHGFNDSEIAQVADARQIAVLRDALMYRQLLASKPEVTKRVTPKQVVQKAGTNVSRADATTQRINALKERANKTGSVDDFGEYFGELERLRG